MVWKNSIPGYREGRRDGIYGRDPELGHEAIRATIRVAIIVTAAASIAALALARIKMRMRLEPQFPPKPMERSLRHSEPQLTETQGAFMCTLDLLSAERDTATFVTAVKSRASQRTCIELQCGEQMEFRVRSTVRIDTFLCTDDEFYVWARGAHASVLAEHTGTTSARFVFRAAERTHLSIVVVNESPSDAKIQIEALIIPASKPPASQTDKAGGSLLQVS